MSRNADRALIPALILGFIGNLLFKNAPPFGINLTLWILLLIISTNYCIYKRQFPWNNHNRIFSWTACVFSVCLSWRDSPVLQLAGFCGLITSIFLASVPIEEFKKRISEWYLIFMLPLDGLLSVIQQALTINGKKETDSIKSFTPVHRSIFIGIVIAIPFLMLFTSLMASADQLFETIVIDTLDLTGIGMFGHLIRWSFCTLFAASLILLWGKKRKSFERKGIPRQSFSLGSVELSTVLLLCNALFATFVVIQISYLFGSHEWIQTTAEHSYAEYARRGFFELCTLVAIVIPMLLFFDWVLADVSKHVKRIFQWLSAGLIAQLFIVIFSALHRMSLYMEQYGLTQLRVYVALFLLWLSGALIWFVFTILRGQQPKFVRGMTYYGMAGLFVLFMINPDYHIMRYNLNRAIEPKEFDIYYAQGLSLDAVPALVQPIQNSNSKSLSSVQDVLKYRFARRTENLPIRSLTWSRYRARNLLLDIGEE
jgi:hypothetical protein